MCHVVRWVPIHFGLPWQAFLHLVMTKWTARRCHNVISWQIWQWIGYGLGWYQLTQPSSILSKEGSLGSATLCLLGVFFRTKCSPPTVQHLANAMASNDPKCFPHWTYLGHDRETYVLTLKTADHISWTWSGAAKGVEQTHSCQLNECLTNCGGQPSNFTSDINCPSRTLMVIKPSVILNYQL